MSRPPLDLERVLREFSGEVPVFPLAGVVLLPDTALPLLIFEDRYREMVKDAIEGDRLIAMALVKEGSEAEILGRPPFHEHVCVGSILQREALPDGRYRILLYGLFRADVQAELDSRPYRRARVEVVPDRARPGDALLLDERLHRALGMAPGKRGLVGRLRQFATEVRGPEGGPGRIADALAEAVLRDAPGRYRILAEPDVLRRLDVLVSLLQRRLRVEGPSRDVDVERN